MYGLPISTERKRQLPKKAIYAKFDLNSVQRESFDADVARIPGNDTGIERRNRG